MEQELQQTKEELVTPPPPPIQIQYKVEKRPANIEKFLENEAQQNKYDSWNKMDKTSKIEKLMIYAENYAKENNLDVDETEHLKNFMIESLDKKKLSRVKDVTYDKDKSSILQIPGLHYNKSSRHFTIKANDKHVSTLKCLAPTKKKSSNHNVIV